MTDLGAGGEVEVILRVPAALYEQLAVAAKFNYRTVEGQLLWLAERGLRAPASTPGRDRVRDPAAEREFTQALRRLYISAGFPSYRDIQQGIAQSGVKVSHTTVGDCMVGKRLPSWGKIEAIVRFLGGDVEEFRLLLAATRYGGTKYEVSGGGQ